MRNCSRDPWSTERRPNENVPLFCEGDISIDLPEANVIGIGTYLASQILHPTRGKSQQLHCFLLLSAASTDTQENVLFCKTSDSAYSPPRDSLLRAIVQATASYELATHSFVVVVVVVVGVQVPTASRRAGDSGNNDSKRARARIVLQNPLQETHGSLHRQHQASLHNVPPQHSVLYHTQAMDTTKCTQPLYQNKNTQQSTRRCRQVVFNTEYYMKF
jgi:hypothetical protein